MKIGIISDTHDRLTHIEKAVDIFIHNNVTSVYHAGDFTSPFTVRAFKRLTVPLKCVFGNNDGDKELLRKSFSQMDSVLENSILFDSPEGLSLAMTHYPETAEHLSGRYDIVIFGHTHKKHVEKKGKSLLVNPGEACAWLTGEASVFILDTSRLDGEFISFQG